MATETGQTNAQTSTSMVAAIASTLSPINVDWYGDCAS